MQNFEFIIFNISGSLPLNFIRKKEIAYLFESTWMEQS